jgi:pimeloyl-ACP methyl ester carboxylesterase
MRPFIPLSIALVCALLSLGSCSTTPAMRDAAGNFDTEGMASLEKVRLGGDEQWISIRGRDPAAPLLLFLHGGPGSSEMPLTRYFLGELEDRFIFVNWDQRGAGKSYSTGAPEKMNIEQFVRDARELSKYLLKRFHRQKLYLLGHSWGTLLGVLTVTRYPELFYAYGGIGQFVDGASNERVAYRFNLQQARETGNEAAMAELTAMDGYPHALDKEGAWLEELQTNRKWLTNFGGLGMGGGEYLRYAGLYLAGPEFNAGDIMKILFGDVESNRLLWPQIFPHNLMREASLFKVPVFFFMGRHDYVTPSELAAVYFDRLKAPEKRFFWFENSAHSPNYEEPLAFQTAVVASFRQHEKLLK